MAPDPRSFSALASGLRFLLAVQRGRLGPHADLLRDVSSLRITEAERDAESAIDRYRAALAASNDVIAMEDFGAGTRAGLLARETKPAERRVAEIYARAAATPAWGRFLFRLVRALRPRAVLELGANLGVSAAHLALALDRNNRDGGPDGRLVTLEGDPTLAERARAVLRDLGQDGRAAVVTGRFDDTLPGVLGTHGPFDLVFLDGHHEEAATLRYFARVRPHLAPGACVAFDDVEPMRPVRRAWRRIRCEHPASGSVYLFGLGLWFAPLTGAGREAAVNEQAAVQ